MGIADAPQLPALCLLLWGSGALLTKHCAILHVSCFSASSRRSFQRRRLAICTMALLAACGEAEAGRWHHGPRKETRRCPPLGRAGSLFPARCGKGTEHGHQGVMATQRHGAAVPPWPSLAQGWAPSWLHPRPSTPRLREAEL